ncbi:BLUF domain-containing protein [Neosynechococcus sphagnicola]|uniref:BLUF domain-containing protein n=1 Tax=Neosynechococcus sphagnicola TaxID=1501145 RepID=UPI0009DD3CBD|nr:BLUF domain-containing protein [Neosynechococcus sphagnicola]
MSLHRMVYFSSAAPGLSYPDLMDIMEKSQTNNAHAGITGLLCSGNGMFLQALEGDRSLVSQTYARILKDPRHFNAEIVEFVAVDARCFTEWSMRLVQLDGFDSESIQETRLRYSSSPIFSPTCMNAKQSLSLLLELYNLGAKKGLNCQLRWHAVSSSSLELSENANLRF